MGALTFAGQPAKHGEAGQAVRISAALISFRAVFHNPEKFLIHTQGIDLLELEIRASGGCLSGPIFFFTSLKAGWRAAVTAMLAETAFRAFTSGCWGALTQALRLMEPAWLAIFLVVFVAPIVVQSLELLVHLASGTPNLKQGFWISCIITGTAALFNWFIMRKGTLITGTASQSLKQDLKNLPLLIFEFVAAIPLALWRLFRPAKPTMD